MDDLVSPSIGQCNVEEVSTVVAGGVLCSLDERKEIRREHRTVADHLHPDLVLVDAVVLGDLSKFLLEEIEEILDLGLVTLEVLGREGV